MKGGVDGWRLSVGTLLLDPRRSSPGCSATRPIIPGSFCGDAPTSSEPHGKTCGDRRHFIPADDRLYVCDVTMRPSLLSGSLAARFHQLPTHHTRTPRSSLGSTITLATSCTCPLRLGSRHRSSRSPFRATVDLPTSCEVDPQQHGLHRGVPHRQHRSRRLGRHLVAQ